MRILPDFHISAFKILNKNYLVTARLIGRWPFCLKNTMPPKKSYESYDSDSDGDLQSPKRGGKKQKLEKNSDEYKKRRERNNVAVRKSREASRQKAKDTMDKVSKLREENTALEQKVTILNKELGVLRDLFLSHASATAQAADTTKVMPKTEDPKNEYTEDSSVKSEAIVTDNFYFVAEGSS